MVESKPVRRESARNTEESKTPIPAAVEKSFEELQREDENDIMNYLDYRKLEKISGDFNLIAGNKEGLDIETFIAVMLHHLPRPSDEVALVRNLMELFEEIDVNGDELLEWVEFTNHIIDLGMVKKDSVYVDTIKDYKLSEIRDVNHDTEIEHIFYMESKQHLIVMERDAKRFKVYNAKNGQLMMSVPSGKTSITGGSFIAADLITHEKNKQTVTWVVTTSSDNIIKTWDPTTNY